MFMLDLCAGTGDNSRAMGRRGWQVVKVDIDPAARPDVVADVRDWSWDGPRPDLVVASPPLDMSVVLACQRIIADCNPRYWLIVAAARLPAGLSVAIARAVEQELGAF